MISKCYNVYLLLAFMFLCDELFGQSFFDAPWVIYQNIKTTTIIPSKKPNHNVSNIIIFEPFVEYRYYKSARLLQSIRDSVFDCKALNIDSNFALYPIRKNITKKYFSRQCFKRLKKYNDTTIVSLNKSSSILLKKELDSVMNLAINTNILEYQMSNKLFVYLCSFRAIQFVMIDILVLEVGAQERPFLHRPSQYYKFNFFVFDTYSKKIFYYDNRCQRNDYLIGSHKDEFYDDRTIHGVFTLKRILSNYKHCLKPYFKYKKNENK